MDLMDLFTDKICEIMDELRSGERVAGFPVISAKKVIANGEFHFGHGMPKGSRFVALLSFFEVSKAIGLATIVDYLVARAVVCEPAEVYSARS